MVDHRADGIRSADALDFAWVVTAVLNAGLTRVALEVVATPDIAVALRDTCFIGQTTVVDYTGFDAEIVDTSFSRSAFSVQCADKAALTVNAGLTFAIVRVGGTVAKFLCNSPESRPLL